VIASGEDAVAPQTVGDIRTGSGNDLLDIRSGAVTGNAALGDGNDQLRLVGTATYSGNAAFGAGDDSLTLGDTASFSGDLAFGAGTNSFVLGGTSSFTGAIDSSGGALAISVGNGRLNTTNTAAIGLSSLSVGGAGHIAVNVNGTAGTATRYDVAGTAAFADGATIDLNLVSLPTADRTFTVVSAGTLTGADGITLASESLPFLFRASLDTADEGDALELSLARKTAGELGLNRSGASAFDAVYSALLTDADLGASFLGINEGGAFRDSFSSLLPDHAGGVFQSVTQASRSVARAAADPNGIRANTSGGLAFWLGQSTWRDKKKTGDTASYSLEGWSFAGGLEKPTGAGTFGVALAYAFNEVEDDRNPNRVYGSQYEGQVYWRNAFGPINADARASVGRVTLKSRRTFDGVDGVGEAFSRSTRAHWNGLLVTAGGNLAYTADLGRFDVRPGVGIDYYRLTEDAHDEAGGGTGFDLAIAKRTSDELAATGSVVLGLNFGSITGDAGWARVEVEGGRREIVSGEAGSTTARFAGGNAFTLAADGLDSGFLGRLRIMGGNEGFRVSGEAGAEQLQGNVAYSLRASLRLAF
jgi:hypothetical protein